MAMLENVGEKWLNGHSQQFNNDKLSKLEHEEQHQPFSVEGIKELYTAWEGITKLWIEPMTLWIKAEYNKETL
jgi:hypothetical protein